MKRAALHAVSAGVITRRALLQAAAGAGALHAAARARSGASSASAGVISPLQKGQASGSWVGVRYDEARGAIILDGKPGSYEHEGTYTSAPFHLDSASGWSLSWRPRWISPLDWIRYPGNPVLTSTAGTWDEGIVTTCSIVRSRDELMLFYGARDRGIGVATCDVGDLAHWRKQERPVLRAGGAGTFDAGGVLSPAVVPVTPSLWYMYYVGYDPSLMNGDVRMHQIGLAQSVDAGRSWTRIGTQPVLSLGPPGSCDGATISSNSVVRIGNDWWCWYTGISQFPYLASICLARSSDGVHWQKYPHNPVLGYNPYVHTDAFVVATPHVLYEEGVFKMWYNSKGYGTGTQPGEYHICYAESLDGIHWDRAPRAPVLGPSGHDWDSQMVEYPEVVNLGGRYYMWYCGNGYGSIGYAEGRPSTQVEVATRAGSSAVPDASWSPWSTHRLPTGSALTAPHANIQIRVTLRTEDGGLTPMVQQVLLRPAAET